MDEKTCRSLEVLENQQLGHPLFYRLRLSSPGWQWTPGQFLMLRSEDWGSDPFTARPFSIADQDENSLHIYFQVVGKATRSLSRLIKGDTVTVWGPLGQGFQLEPQVPTLLLAGGMGIAPFVGLVRSHSQPQNLEMIFGHRHDLGCYPFEELSLKILAWAVQDRSELDLEKLYRALSVKIGGYAPDGRILACGPRPFLKLVKQFSSDCQGRAQLGLETHMACGIGACLGCAVQRPDGGYVQACLQGPVFSAEEIML